MSEDRYYTVKDASEVLGLSEYTVRKKIREGEIAAIHGASDREGYKIPHDELIAYMKKSKRSGIAGLFAGAKDSPALGFMVGVGAGAALPILGAAIPGALFGGLGLGGISKVVTDAMNGVKKEGVDEKEVLDLSVGSLQDEIDALKFWIEGLELNGDSLSVDDKKKILDAKVRIKLLERQIKEIKLKHTVKSNKEDGA